VPAGKASPKATGRITAGSATSQNGNAQTLLASITMTLKALPALTDLFPGSHINPEDQDPISKARRDHRLSSASSSGSLPCIRTNCMLLSEVNGEIVYFCRRWRSARGIRSGRVDPDYLATADLDSEESEIGMVVFL
jgi:hypothetical protein